MLFKQGLDVARWDINDFGCFKNILFVDFSENVPRKNYQWNQENHESGDDDFDGMPTPWLYVDLQFLG